MTRLAVIGAGITGVSTASSLMDRGLDVTLFDRNRYAAMQTSFANGGQLSASNAETWNRWATVFKGMRWMLTRGAPLLVNPAPSWHKYSWMAEFIAAIPQYRDNTIATARMAIAARGLLREKAARYGFDFDAEDRGILHIYTDRAEFAHAGRVTALLAEAGLTRRAVTPEEIRSLEPALSGDFHGGYYTDSDFTGDIHRYTMGLAQGIARDGTDLRFGTEIEGLTHGPDGICVTWTRGADRQSELFDAIVICAGVESRRFAAMLGDRVNVYPVKGYSITVRLDDEASQQAAPWVSLLDDQAKIVTSRLGRDRFRIAGTAEFNGTNLDIRDDRIRPLVAWCERFFPGVSTEHAIPWAGLRPMMPNMMPRVGPGRRPRVFYNTGHGHLGWTLSAATAEMVAEAVTADATLAPARPHALRMAAE
ncbi:D-amino acid dehydrogenase [Roseicyclus mahoneyensis]|uniref:D-amino acid dehydrogenase small subunit n=1 Tax=Roseicyclus mahoneyensis TaxID=164332 RepID=A0A316GBQ2_9RHOB|nr:D-amino acid dehydrogenase [Roseicyclus mahoneyensis]PWK58023.1 D-amino acid dehydrogenase small subunit [Roseicyclus mahoneyensis]